MSLQYFHVVLFCCRIGKNGASFNNQFQTSEFVTDDVTKRNDGQQVESKGVDVNKRTVTTHSYYCLL